MIKDTEDHILVADGGELTLRSERHENGLLKPCTVFFVVIGALIGKIRGPHVDGVRPYSIEVHPIISHKLRCGVFILWQGLHLVSPMKMVKASCIVYHRLFSPWEKTTHDIVYGTQFSLLSGRLDKVHHGK